MGLGSRWRGVNVCCGHVFSCAGVTGRAQTDSEEEWEGDRAVTNTAWPDRGENRNDVIHMCKGSWGKTDGY